jgi:hypothetical protein
MPTKVTMVRIMIASPSDVSNEREIVRKALAEWNDINTLDRELVLHAVGWETHASPEMLGRPQAIISKQILEDCDLLVAVFWTRLGSRTGTEVSGTVEEIKEHLAAGKQAMIYFSLAPVAQQSIDNEQWSGLQQFKTEIRKLGLVQEYESLSQFRELFARHLAQTIIRQFPRAKDGALGIPNVGARPTPIQLTTEAQQLLADAAHTTNGVVMMLSSLDGLSIQTDDTVFSAGGDSREEAIWRSALQLLHSRGLVEDRTGKGELFYVTQHGYDVAELLGPIEPEPEAPE